MSGPKVFKKALLQEYLTHTALSLFDGCLGKMLGHKVTPEMSVQKAGHTGTQGGHIQNRDEVSDKAYRTCT